jgi:Uma2 family endonuclease
MRNPDAAWISNEQYAKLSEKEIKKSFAYLCPDFIVELKSHSDTIEEQKMKMKEWMENGCRMGWLVDVDEEIIYIYEENKPVRMRQGFDQILSGEPVLLGFEFVWSPSFCNHFRPLDKTQRT